MVQTLKEHIMHIINHFRENVKFRHFLQVHGLVLWLAGWKVFFTKVWIAFIVTKIVILQMSVIKAFFGLWLLVVFPLGNEVVEAANNLGEPFCGNGITEGDEICDDWNQDDADMCDNNCVWEVSYIMAKDELDGNAVDLYPVLSHALSNTLATFQKACHTDPTDSTFLKTLEDTHSMNGKIDPLHLLSSYCIIDQYDEWRYSELHESAVTSRADAFKMIAKAYALGDDSIEFDEQWIYLGNLPYTDVYHDARYTEYVIYLNDLWLLDGIGNKNLKWQRTLEALLPITKSEVKKLLTNLEVKKSYPILDEPGTYVYREEFAAIVADIFKDKFVYYQYMRGGNVAFFNKFLGQIEGKNNVVQGVYIKLLFEKLRSADPAELLAQQNLYVDSALTFLDAVVQQAKVASTQDPTPQ